MHNSIQTENQFWLPSDIGCPFICPNFVSKYVRIIRISEMYSDLSQTSKMEVFAKKCSGFQLLTIFAKSSIVDVRIGFL